MTDRNLASLDVFARALRSAPIAANQAAEVALNEGAAEALKLGTRQILKELNLEKAYVTKHLKIKKQATRGDLLAKVGAKKRPVLATRYGAKLKTVSNTTNRKHHTGDAYRRIGKGEKAAGSTAWNVKRGAPKKEWANTFFIWGRDSGAWIMVRKTGKGRDDFETVYSTSVDQAWKNVRDDVAPAAMSLAARVFSREFKRRR